MPGILGHGIEHNYRDHSLLTETVRSSGTENRGVAGRQDSLTSAINATGGSNDIYEGSSPFSSIEIPPYSEGAIEPPQFIQTVRLTQGQARLQGQDSSKVSSSPTMVGRHTQPQGRATNAGHTANYDTDHRRIRHRLGRPFNEQESARDMAILSRAERPHKHEGKVSSPVLTETISTHDQRQDSITEMRQHGDGVLPQQRGGDKVIFIERSGNISSELVSQNRVHLNIQYMAGKLNTVADSLSRQRKFKDTEWQIAQDMTTVLFELWPLPTIDLFATSQNAKCKAFITRVPDKHAIGWDALQMNWDNLDTYAFPPFPLIMKVLQKVKRSHNMHMTLIVLMWQSQGWFPTLLEMLIDMPRSLPPRPDLLTQPDGTLPMSPAVYQSHAWRLSSNLSLKKLFQVRSHRQQAAPMHGAQRAYTSAIGLYSALGVYNGITIHSIPLCHS
jgi:hypothetical protein